VTGAERTLLLAVFRWARAEGVRLDGATRWTSPPPHRWGVEFWGGLDDRPVFVWREGQIIGSNYDVVDIAEAVDLLAALGILPAQFSTAYRAGYDACMRAHQIAESRLPDRPLFSRGWTDPEVYALLPWADHELAVRR
jgi:hypothetical protein